MRDKVVSFALFPFRLNLSTCDVVIYRPALAHVFSACLSFRLQHAK